LRPGRWAANVVKRAVLVLGALGVTLGLGELGVRLAVPQERALVRGYVRPDAELGSVHKPRQDYFDRHWEPLYAYHVRTNDYGYRMDEDVNPSPAVRKVLALGDSFTFGWGVEIEDAFFSLLKRRVEGHHPRVQLLNGGQDGFSTGHVYKKLRRESARLNLCAALYFMNAGDLADNLNLHPDYRVTSFQRATDGAIILTDEKVFSPFKRFLLLHVPGYDWLNQHSHVFVLAKRSVQRRAAAVVPFGPEPAVAGADPELMTDVTLAHLERIAGLARTSGFKVMVVWVPGSTELFAPDDGLNAVLARLKSRVPRIAGLQLFDPTPGLREVIRARYRPEDLYFRDYQPFGHFNRGGNALFAATSAEAVERFVGEAMTSCGK